METPLEMLLKKQDNWQTVNTLQGMGLDIIGETNRTATQAQGIQRIYPTTETE